MYLSIYHLSVYIYPSIHPSIHLSIITYLSFYIYFGLFILSLLICFSTSVSTLQTPSVFLSVYIQCVVLLLGNTHNILSQHTFCQQSAPKHQNINMSTALNTVHTCPYTYQKLRHVVLYLYPPGSFCKHFSSLHLNVCYLLL